MPVDAIPTTQQTADDESLATAMRDSDDQAAYGQLLGRHSLTVFAFCRARVFSSGDVEDVAQEVWMKVWDRRAQFQEQGPTSFRRWLFTVAGRTCIDCNRKKRPETGPEGLFENLSTASESDSPDWTPLLVERQKVLEHCIAQLTDRQQCVVRATLAGHKTGVAAKQCQCTPAQAANAKHQAIGSLQECTAKKGV